MRASKNAIDLIKKFEGCRFTSYKPVATEVKYTIGYGHYGVGKDVKITQQQADEYLIQDMQRAVQQVNKYVTLYHFNQNEFDALVSFAYNVGNIKGVTSCGERTKTEIACAMLNYTHDNKGKVLKGLVTRRNMECHLFTTPIS